MQQDIDVPDAVVSLRQKFRASPMGEQRRKVNPGRIGDKCFEYLHLRSAIRNGEMTNPRDIREAALVMDSELEAWRGTLEPKWLYGVINVEDNSSGTYFNSQRHTYHSLWAAQNWNNWRTLRILINKLVLEHDPGSSAADDNQSTTSLSIIHRYSTEVCISAPDFMGSPRKSSKLIGIRELNLNASIGSGALIWPLFVVAGEQLNATRERLWAVEHLRRLNSVMGIRQADFLAESISQTLGQSTVDTAACTDIMALQL
jgi:hypothetical protein